MDVDYHAHSSYSDGRHLPLMIEAAVEAGLDGIGFADHANVSSRSEARRAKLAYAFNLDQTFERRREAIELFREEYDIRIFDAVEVDYHPADEAEIRGFLDDADFQYVIGSVHEVEGVNVHFPGPFKDLSGEKKRAVVDQYFDRVEALVRSELFEVAAHPDIIERNDALRGLSTEQDYRQIAEALADSRTIAEINAGRVDEEYGRFHPGPAFLDVLLDYDLDLTLGTDSHQPESIEDRVSAIRDLIETRGIEPISPLATADR